jgi:L-malate glycosyltransferase
MKKVIILQRRMVHYRIDMFELLSSELRKNKIELQVFYGQPTEAEEKKQDSAFLNVGVFRKNYYFNLFGKTVNFKMLKLSDIKGADLVIIPQENSYMTGLFVLLFKNLLNIKSVAYWGHGENFQAKTPSISERVKKRLLLISDFFFCYTELSRDKIISRGYEKSNIATLNNAIDSRCLRSGISSVTVNEKAGFLNKYNLHGGALGLYLGSMYKEKEIPFLLEAISQIKNDHPEFEMIFIGAGEDSCLIETFCAENSWAIYLGPCSGHTKYLALALSSIILNPGLVGLGILDSFASRVPLITTDITHHSPEIAYLKHMENGMMTPFDLNEYSKGVVNVLDNDELKLRLINGCEMSFQYFTLESMVEKFNSGILAATDR